MIDSHIKIDYAKTNRTKEVKMEKTIKVDGMTCEHCKMRVEMAVSKVAGVTSAVASLNDGTVIVQSDGDVEKAVVAAIEDAGYDVIA